MKTEEFHSFEFQEGEKAFWKQTECPYPSHDRMPYNESRTEWFNGFLHARFNHRLNTGEKVWRVGDLMLTNKYHDYWCLVSPYEKGTPVRKFRNYKVDEIIELLEKENEPVNAHGSESSFFLDFYEVE